MDAWIIQRSFEKSDHDSLSGIELTHILINRKHQTVSYSTSREGQTKEIGKIWRLLQTYHWASY